MNTNTIEVTRAMVCEPCASIPISHLGLDLDEPTAGWGQMLVERGVEVTEDDLGRPSVGREVLAELLAENREREAREAARQAEQAAQRVPVPAGVPALEGATAFESMAAAGVVLPSQEFVRPRPNFVAAEIEAGRKQAAELEAEAALIAKARRVLEDK